MLTEEHDREYYRAGKADEDFHDALVSEYGEHLAGDARYWPTDSYPEAIQVLELDFRRACDRLHDHCRIQREEPTRRAEVDAWLQQVGAAVIQVQDLGAALEAREVGSRLVEFSTRALHHASPLYPWTLPVRSYSQASTAAHLARVALGVGR